MKPGPFLTKKLSMNGVVPESHRASSVHSKRNSHSSGYIQPDKTLNKYSCASSPLSKSIQKDGGDGGVARILNFKEF